MMLYKKREDSLNRNSQVRDIVAYLEHHQVILPNGGHLTPGRWQHLGIDFGMSGQCHSCFFLCVSMPTSPFIGGIDRVHREWEGRKSNRL